jgi:hypothetical protein
MEEAMDGDWKENGNDNWVLIAAGDLTVTTVCSDIFEWRISRRGGWRGLKNCGISLRLVHSLCREGERTDAVADPARRGVIHL